MIVNTKTTKNQSQFNDCQNVCDAFIGFRLSSVQLAELKSQAKKEKRNISNFIKSKLF